VSSFPSIKQIFDNPAVAAAVIFCVAAVIGQIMHGVKKSLDGEVSCIEWFSKGIGRTLSAMIGNGGGMLLFIQSGALETVYQGQNGWWHLILFGLMNGFAADSALNKAIASQPKSLSSTTTRAASSWTGFRCTCCLRPSSAGSRTSRRSSR